MAENKVDVPAQHWDQLWALSAAPAVVTTVNAQGAVNAAAFGACVRIAHDPVAVTFTVGVGRDTTDNVLGTGEFVVNHPAFDPDQLASMCVTGLDFEPGVNELERAGLTALPGRRVRPPRIAEYGRHFECKVLWNMVWRDRVTVVGEVVAASCDDGLLDANGDIRWEVARPVTYCGGPYGHTFTPSFETMTVEVPGAGAGVLAGLRPIPDSYRGILPGG